MKGRSLILSMVFALITVATVVAWLSGSLEVEYRLATLVGGITCLTMTLALLRLARVNQHQFDLSQRNAHLVQEFEQRNKHLSEANERLQQEIARHEITEELLQETQEYLHGIINSMPSIIIGVTQDGVVTLWNRGAQQAFGIHAEEILGLPLFEIFPELPANIDMVQKAIDSGEALIKENLRQGEGSQAIYSDLAVYPVVQDEFGGAVIRLDDITMKVRLENMMIQNEKMLSLGELAAGMAHEINNPLSAIMQGVQNIRRRLSVDMPANQQVAEHLEVDMPALEAYMQQRGIPRFLAMVEGAGERAANIVTNMLEFSRSNSVQHSLVNINELIEHSLDLAISTFDIPSSIGKQRIRINKRLAEDIPAVLCSGAEIQQVLLNLLRNASQAMSDMAIADPEISISTKQLAASIEIRVKDNGPGMEEDVRQHIFEPFYTTKSTGKGTGLGLSVSYFIITEHHQGSIEVESEMGKGSEFIIRLPTEVEKQNDYEHIAILEKAQSESVSLSC